MKIGDDAKDYLKSVIRFFGMTTLSPFLIGVVGAFSAGIGFLLFIIGVPLTIVVVVIGSGVWLVRGLRRARSSEKPLEQTLMILASPALLMATVAIAWPILAAGNYLGTLSRLLINRDHYEAIVENARTTGEDAWFAEHDGVTYSVDPGPPLRVAFNPAGLLDNWSGIIYDPTGDVMMADGFDPRSGKFVAPDRVTKLFGGDLVRCRHLWGDYYDCSFT